MDNYLYADGERQNRVIDCIAAGEAIKILGLSNDLDHTDGFMVTLEGPFLSEFGDKRKFELKIYDEVTEKVCCPAQIEILRYWPNNKAGKNTLLFIRAK